MTLVGDPEVVELQSALEPQLVVMVFTIAAAEHRDKQGLLISGNLHVRTPTSPGATRLGTSLLTISQKTHALSAERLNF